MSDRWILCPPRRPPPLPPYIHTHAPNSSATPRPNSAALRASSDTFDAISIFQAAIVQVTGGVYIEYAAVTTLAGRLPLLERVGGTFRIHNNPRLTALDAFGSLRSIGGDLVISTNPELLVINGSAFGALETVGRRFALTGHSQLHTVASSAFGALETVGDYFLVQQVHQITDLGDGVFGALRSVGVR